MQAPGLPRTDVQAFCPLRGQGLSPKSWLVEQGLSTSVQTCLVSGTGVQATAG